EIEKANPHTLFGIFGDAPWTNKERLSDHLLTDLLEHFPALPLSVKAVTADALGNAYEYLIKQFADKANKKAGEFYTPRPRVDPSDVVQQAHLEALPRLPDYLQRQPLPFRLWLRQIAHDQVLKARRRPLGTARRALDREVPLPERSLPLVARGLLDAGSTP